MTTNDQPMDHVPPDATADDDKGSSDLEKNVKQKSTWVRLFFMIVLAFLYGLSRFVIGAVIVIQFFYVLLTGKTKDVLKSFGHSLAIYSYEVIDYLTFNTDEKPFPFDGNWPTSLPKE
jgi:uncharacterized protein YqhQ